jgi:hypothetical protein
LGGAGDKKPCRNDRKKSKRKNHDQPGLSTFQLKKQDYEKNKTRSKSDSVLRGGGLEHGHRSSPTVLANQWMAE